MTEVAGGSPLATVVITTHDRPELARRALESALAQTLRDIEVVVVDDGSQPPFETGIDDDRVRVIRHERAGGVCRARNAGLAAARGAWITFLDDDDVLAPGMLERSLAAAESSPLPHPVAVMSAVSLLDEDGVARRTLVPPVALRRGEDYFLERRGAAGRAANTLVAPTAVLRGIGGWDEHLEAFQHDDLGLRLNAVASIQGIAEPLYVMTTHRAPRVSARWSVIPSDMQRTLEKHPAAFARHREAHARFLGTTGYYHLKAGNWLAAIRWCARGVRRNAADRRLWFFLGAALAGPHAWRAYRRLVPKETSVSYWTLTRRRARKYAGRAGDHLRAVVAAPCAMVTRRVIDARVLPRVTDRSRRVLLACVFRSANVAVVSALVDEARGRGWEVRLWALDHVAPSLAAYTVGKGPGAKFPLLNRLLSDLDVGRFDWVVVADDDVAFGHGSIERLLDVAETAGLEFVQPAHTELSHRDLDFALRRPLSIARRTTFVEIGPLFAVHRSWIADVLPFPSGHTMGWGLELEWSELAERGARLGIVDGVPVRHLQPVGRGYGKREQLDRLRALLAERGLGSLADVQRTIGTWYVWQRAPRW